MLIFNKLRFLVIEIFDNSVIFDWPSYMTWRMSTSWNVQYTPTPGGGEGGLTCYDFRYGRATAVPGLHPIHILGKGKTHTHSYTYHSENCTYSYTIFHNLPIHILFGKKDTPAIYFWSENDTHSYTCTDRPEKYSPFWSVYTCTFIMDVNPPMQQLLPPTYKQTYWMVSVSCMPN